ncbi:lysozyme inhibitor LprI family protein [Granulicella tundricola]|uniref:Lysozyme inhibitor LprI-like N-terminal domain-containing protein n=1 Tax=Granulicella tundricola (strain ATCC BAA-1859 / DSM 23138 / MP5ACTX9) TaxID=1198114 RepID=E8X147_GRATM|nr:lysozyme inhibitor LprI family protein [Granulicella tundricola]ADW67913.1 hypothetical protein AciX9_0845 [Granulicella tundricola MP5ACTX9]
MTKSSFRNIAASILALATVTAAADCTKAITPIDKTVCQTPELTKLDADLNHLYTALRPQLTIGAKARLLTQQRTWLALRDKTCATADAACLQHQYADRLDQLEAINASAKAADDKLDDVTPVYLKGSWKVTAIHDPAGRGHTNPTALKQSLEDEELSPPGSTVVAAPGELCFPPDPCGDMAWDFPPLGKVASGSAIIEQLGLTPATRALRGSSGTINSHYLLIPRPDGSLWAAFILCGPAVGQDCRTAAEVWTPATPDARVFPTHFPSATYK